MASSQVAVGPLLPAIYYDGHNAQAHAVTLQVQGPTLCIEAPNVSLRVPLDAVRWPEATRHGVRVAALAAGGQVQSDDAPAWDAWRHASGQSTPLTVHLQQSWRAVAASAAALVLLLAAGYAWGLPLLAGWVVRHTPHTVALQLGRTALATLDAGLMQPSQLDARTQGQVMEDWRAVAAQMPQAPAWQVVFRHSRSGPNAFALPDGTLVLTDDMVRLLDGNPQAMAAVLGHELGHVQHQDALRLLVQASALGGAATLLLGDFSGSVAALPVLLGQAQYSRMAEHEADAYALQVLHHAHIPPHAMVTLFERLAEWRQAHHAHTDESWLGIAFASHPPDAERLAYFRDAAP